MSLASNMTFCWRRFRHFVAAYFALGLAATATHSAIVLSSLDAIASETEEPVAIVEEIPAPVEEAPVEEAVEPVDVNVEEAPTEPEVVFEEEPTDEEGGEDSEATPSQEISENPENIEEVAPTEVEPTVAEPIEEVPTEPETPNEESAPAEDPAPGSDTPVVSPEVEETPIPEEPSQEEQAPISWPEERISPPAEEVTFELPPYSEARSTIEAVAPKLDWMYTLRAGAEFTQISVAKLATTTDLNALVQILENNGTNSAINEAFCEVEADLEQLDDLYAPGSDDTQPEVDADNQEILEEISTAVSQIRDTWIIVSGSSYQCN